MNPENVAELAQVLAAMKVRGADRAELSRQAANAMFFKWGERPSVVAVRQVTATGSNTDIARDLEAWWGHLREKTALNLQADLQPLADTVTPLLRAIMGEAGKAAAAALDAEREQVALQDAERVRAAQERVDNAQALQRAAEAATQAARTEAAAVRAELARERQEREVESQGLRHELQLAGERALAAQATAAQRESALLRELNELKNQLATAREELETQRHEAARDRGFAEDRRRMLENLLAQSNTTNAQLQASLKESAAQLERADKRARDATEQHAAQLEALSLALGQAKGQLQGLEIERDRLAGQITAAQQERQALERQLAERAGVQSALDALLSRRHGVPHLDDVHRAIAKHFEIDALTLEELILAALENKGRIPAGVRKRYKAKMPEGLVEAIEAEVRERLSSAISGR